jgi:predicted DNA-binding antitoxin AbrB/MazE fold protein
MTTTVEAIYEDGKLLLPKPLPLPEKSHVQVTIESPPASRVASPTEKLLDLERRNRIWRELDDSEGW